MAKSKTTKPAEKLTISKLEGVSIDKGLCAENVTRALTDELKHEYEEELGNWSIKNRDQEDERAEFMEEWKAKNKPVKHEVGRLVGILRDGEVTTTDMIYRVRDESDVTKIHLYDEVGEFIMTREATAGELQMQIGEQQAAEPQQDAEAAE